MRLTEMLSSFDVNRCFKEFGFLEDRYGFPPALIHRNEFSITVSYKKKTVAVTVYFEPYDYGLAVFVAKEDTGQNGNGSVAEQYSLNTGLRLRSPDSPLLRKSWTDWASMQDIYDLLELCAEELQTHGQDILAGDFSVFAKLKELMGKDRP